MSSQWIKFKMFLIDMFNVKFNESIIYASQVLSSHLRWFSSSITVVQQLIRVISFFSWKRTLFCWKKMNNAVCDNKNLSKLALGCGNISKIVKMHYSFKGRGPGINSSQSKNVRKIQLSMQLPHLSIIFFLNIWFQWF